MAEFATIARPYAEALYQAAGAQAASLVDPLAAMASVSADARVQELANSPKASSDVTRNVMADVLGRVGVVLPPALGNLLSLVLENGRLAVLPEISAQYRVLVNQAGGVSDALIESAFPLDAQQLADVQRTLEARFQRKLTPKVVVQPELIGGLRVVVGDEVLDTSVRARLEQMKAALTA